MHVRVYYQVGKLKLVRSFLDVTSSDVPVTVCKLAMLSLMEVFKDILPDYRIRLFTSTEKHQKVGHEVIVISTSRKLIYHNQNFNTLF